MDLSHSIPKDVNELYEVINKTKKFTHKKIDELKEKVFRLKIKYIENEKIYRILDHIITILGHENRKLNTLKMTLISALGTIFLPLSFITGYFGMNFRSMGNPSLKKGILATKHVEVFIFALSIISMIVIGSVYYIHF